MSTPFELVIHMKSEKVPEFDWEIVTSPSALTISVRPLPDCQLPIVKHIHEVLPQQRIQQASVIDLCQRSFDNGCTENRSIVGIDRRRRKFDID
ncbi:hypothetical protein J6590_017295 [Homalodisca vitripennis]|nr:hypothetical protein J6590_017295 [Homalodisca vitripennis]